jgi:hypothetical protein
MKLQAPSGFTGDVHLHGRSFVVDKKGQVEIPDNLLGQSLWQQGFTVVVESDPKAVKPIANEVTGKDKA